MSDTVFSVGLRSAEYYRELKKLGFETDREATKVERRIESMERRVDRAAARALAEERKSIQARLAERERYEQTVGRIAQRGRGDNARLNARLDSEIRQEGLMRHGARMQQAEQAKMVRAAALESETQMFAVHHRRLQMRTAIHAQRMAQIESRGMAGRMRMQGIGSAASLVGLPGIGRLGGVASAGKVGVAGVAAFGAVSGVLNLVRDAYHQSNEAQAAMARLKKEAQETRTELAKDASGFIGELTVGAEAASRTFNKLWRQMVDVGAFLGNGFDADDIRGQRAVRDQARISDAEQARRMAGATIGEQVFGVDPAVARRRSVNQAIDSNGLRGSEQGSALLDRLAAAEAAEMQARNREAQQAAAERRASGMMLEAQIAGQRAQGTETLDDDKRAAQMLYMAQLEEARVRVLADEMIPEGERYNQLMRETALLGAQYSAVLAGIEEAEADRAARLEQENRAREAAIDLFQEQLAIEEAMALGQTKLAEGLRAEADLRRRMEEIERLGLSGEERADAERRAMSIFNAQGQEKSETRTVGFSGLAGGATLMRQMAGVVSPQAKLLGVNQRMLKVLEEIEKKTGGAARAG